MKNNAKIITAPAGRGKTYHLVSELANHLNSLKGAEKFHPKKIIVVPYGEQAKRLRDLLLKQIDEPVLFSRSVLSYGDFIQNLFPQIQGREISNIQKKLILKEILETIPFQYYETARRLSSFADALASFISEWKGLFLTEKDFKDALTCYPADEVSYLKLLDLKSVFTAYEKRKKSLNLFDFDDAFREAL